MAEEKMSEYHMGFVYIIFGDVPRSDGSNIYSVMQTEESAKYKLEFYRKTRPDTEFSIERYDVWEYA